MAKITLPYTLANGNTADGGQVQQDLDAIVTQVNGNLDGNNIAPSGVGTLQINGGAVTLPKLASEVKVLEAVYSNTWGAISITPNTETEVLSQSLNLSTARYVLFLITAGFSAEANTSYVWDHILDDGATLLQDFQNFVNNNTAQVNSITASFHHFSQLSSGTHTISLKVRQSYSSDTYSGPGRMTIVQFAF